MSQSSSELDRLAAELTTYAGRLVRAVTRTAADGVPAATLRLLSQIDQLGQTTVGHLAVADRCSQPTMSAAVATLTRKGWAVKRPHPADARSSLVSLTDEGRAVLAAARRRNGDVVAAQLRTTGLGADDLATTVATLRTLLEAFPTTSDTTDHLPTPVREGIA